MSKQKKFRGVLQPDGTGLNWVVVRLPFDAAKVWPERKRMRVKGTINGFAFRTSLFGSPRGGQLLLVNKKMQKGAGVRVGGTAEIVLEPDLEERVATVPPELEKLLRQNKALKKWFEGMSYSMRKYMEDAIRAGKSPAARVRQAEEIVERMMLAMEGEREVPPILRAAFRRSPRAEEGWKVMTPTQRRGHLLGIFYYKSPEARQKRTEKAVAEALMKVREG